MKYLFSAKSKNSKTGVMPVTSSSHVTCPDACALKSKGCYAKYSFLGMLWKRLDSGKIGMNWQSLIKSIEQIKSGSLWRYNQMGDLPGINNAIDSNKMLELIRANMGKRGFTYTHKPLTKENLKLIRHANKLGFTVNISTDNLVKADEAYALSLPVCTIVNSEYVEKTGITPGNNKFIICPAQLNKLTCLQCGICAKANRKFIVAFKAHGICKKIVNKLAE